jgi:ketosteroid isomerase-like protein
MKNTRIALWSLAALWLIGCGQTDTRQADIQALKDTEARWNQEYAAKDLDKIVAHYNENAVLMVPGDPASTGTASIRKLLGEMVSDPAFSLKFGASKVEVAKSDDLGYTQGMFEMTMTDPTTKQVVHSRGNYVTAYAKQSNGSWKATADIATPDMPPPAPAMSASK